MRKYGKVDHNQAEIVAALEQAGCSVLSLASMGNGAPDLLVARKGINYLLEVKNPEVRGSKLTPDQVKFHRNWRGKVSVVSSVDEAFEAVGIVEAAITARG